MFNEPLTSIIVVGVPAYLILTLVGIRQVRRAAWAEAGERIARDLRRYHHLGPGEAAKIAQHHAQHYRCTDHVYEPSTKSWRMLSCREKENEQ